MRSILVHADKDAAFEGRLQTALDLARKFEGHVTLLIATPLRQFVSFDPFGGTYFAAEALAAAQAEDLALESRLAERLADEDVPWDIAMADGDVAGALAGAATFADLAIVSLPAGEGEGRGDLPLLAGDVALAASVPVLALPRETKSFAPEGSVMVAWNGSTQSARALRAALPLLQERAVTLVTVDEEDGDKDGFPATDALRYLSRHDIHGELKTVARSAESVGQQLVAEAAALGAGVIVTGAFGRSRLRETLFGGVTRHLLSHSRTPLLLAH